MPWAKSVVGALILLAVPFFTAGPIAGSVCLFLALCVALVAWTPLGAWLGFHGKSELAAQLDALMREGMELLDELMAPPQIEETGEGEWAMEFGDAPPEWNDKADAFYKTIKDLLAVEHPALIPDFEKGFNERLRIQRERETRKVASQQPGKRSTAQTMIDFATDTQRAPAKVVEACLEGLSHARKAI